MQQQDKHKQTKVLGKREGKQGAYPTVCFGFVHGGKTKEKKEKCQYYK